MMPGALGNGERGYCLMEFQFGKMKKFWKWIVACTTLWIYLMPRFCIFLDSLFIYLVSVHHRADNMNCFLIFSTVGFPGGTQMVAQKNPPANAGDTCDTGSIPGSGRSTEVGNGNSSTLAWKISWTKETSRLQSTMSQRVGHDWAHTHDALVFVEKPPRAGQFLKIN